MLSTQLADFVGSMVAHVEHSSSQVYAARAVPSHRRVQMRCFIAMNLIELELCMLSEKNIIELLRYSEYRVLRSENLYLPHGLFEL